MIEPIICVYCGDPIPDGDGRRAISTGLRHARLDKCVYVLKSRMRVLTEALESASAERDRYRGALVALRDAERALKAASASFAEEAALNAAIDAAIAAVEEG